jgi:predicted translin family RNA/ssDNA-binding protein
MPKKELAPFINAAEYINGLSDFTGEIGRIAVFEASAHHLDDILLIQQIQVIVYDFTFKMQTIASNSGNTGGGYGSFAKKLDAVRFNLRKVENIIYELKMLERSGRNLRMKIEEPNPANINNNDDGEENL